MRMAEIQVTPQNGEGVFVRSHPADRLTTWHVIDFAKALEEQQAPSDVRIEVSRSDSTMHWTGLSARWYRDAPLTAGQSDG
jgi:hypothetical protein